MSENIAPGAKRSRLESGDSLSAGGVCTLSSHMRLEARLKSEEAARGYEVAAASALAAEREAQIRSLQAQIASLQRSAAFAPAAAPSAAPREDASMREEVNKLRREVAAGRLAAQERDDARAALAQVTANAREMVRSQRCTTACRLRTGGGGCVCSIASRCTARAALTHSRTHTELCVL